MGWIKNRVILAKSVIRGEKLVKKLCCENDTVFVLNNQHIGDVCYALSFLNSYKEYYGLKSLTVIWAGKFREVYESFNVNDLQLLNPEEQMDILYFLSYVPRGKRLVSNNRFIVTYSSYYLSPREQEERGLSMIELLRNYAFQLPADIKPTFPKITNSYKLRTFIHYAEITPQKTVLVNPQALSMAIPRSFFQKIADELKQRGYLVVSNLSNEKDKPLDGTLGVYLSLNDTYSLLELCGHTIGVRSGFYDFMISANCRFFILYSEEYSMKKSYTLKAWNSERCVYEYIFSELRELAIMDEILSNFPTLLKS